MACVNWACNSSHSSVAERVKVKNCCVARSQQGLLREDDRQSPSVCFGCEPDAQVLKDRLAKREAMVRTPIGGSSVPELLCTFSKGLD